jgi:hypothetical protein
MPMDIDKPLQPDAVSDKEDYIPNLPPLKNHKQKCLFHIL